MRLVRAAVAAAVVLGGIVAVGALGPQPIHNYAGDQLGPEPDEPVAAYVARAEESVAALGPEDSQEASYALVSFERALMAGNAASAVEGAERVSALVISKAAPIAIPEPVDGATREDVFIAELDRIQASLAGVGNVRGPRTIDAVVVHATPGQLRTIAANPDVLAVEALPSDAPWGGFGVHPPAELAR